MKGKIGTALALSFTAVVFGGGACSTPSTKGDSESHFLHECVETCASGLECLCGICTRTCTDTSQCASLAATAECAAALESACAAHGKQCDVPCLTSDACRGLGAGYSCVGGRCRDTGAAKDAGGADPHDAGGGGNAKDAPFPSPDSNGGCNYDGICEANESTTSCSRDCGSVPACTLKSPPAPLGVDGGSSGGTGEIVAIVSQVDLGDAPSNPTDPPTHFLEVGLDIDGRCTTGFGNTLRSNQECVVPTQAFGVADGDHGVDNAFGKMVQILRDNVQTFSSDIATQYIARGGVTHLIHVTGLAPGPGDDDVHVAWYETAPSAAPPLWDGTDRVAVDRNSLADGVNPTNPRYSVSGYVSAGMLVARFNSLPYHLVVPITAQRTVDVELPLADAHVVCKFGSSTPPSLESCTLEGRVLADDVVHQLAAFPDPAVANSALCTTSQLYATFRDNFCKLVDVNSSRTETADPCSALSIGMTFQTKPGLLGSAATVTRPSEPCPPGARPSEDSCVCAFGACSTRDAGQSPVNGTDSGTDAH